METIQVTFEGRTFNVKTRIWSEANEDFHLCYMVYIDAKSLGSVVLIPDEGWKALSGIAFSPQWAMQGYGTMRAAILCLLRAHGYLPKG